MIIPNAIEYYYEGTPKIFDLIKPIACNIGCALLVAGIISILIETTGFIEYASKVMERILIDDKYIDKLNKSKLESLKSSIEKRLVGSEIQEDSLYYVVEKEIKPLLKEPYYNFYDINIDCAIENNMITKTVTRRVEIDCLDKENVFIYPKKLTLCSFRSIEGYKNTDLFSVKSFKINNEEFISKIGVFITDGDDPKYNKRGGIDVSAIYDKLKMDENKMITQETVLETIVPITDDFVSIRPAFPTKQYSATFNYDSTICKVRARCFGFMNKEDKENKALKYYKNSVSVKFRDWILPGDGAIFIIKKM